MKEDLELNKVAAAILIAGILAMIAGFISDGIYGSDHSESDDHAVRGYKIEGAVIEASSSQAPKVFEWPDFDIKGLMAKADAEAGKALFNKCSVCHSNQKGGTAKVGPNLWEVVGHKRAAHADYSYSNAMASHAGEEWTYESLFKFIYSPKEFVPGTKMGFAGFKKPEEVANLIAYLRNLSDSPKPLP